MYFYPLRTNMIISSESHCKEQLHRSLLVEQLYQSLLVWASGDIPVL